ncbi:protein SENSITIVE TO PROTON RHIZOTOXICITY 2-like [Arachis duranensis]|uniref:Protein SENSITIVE TO PROTON RHIZOTOXICITY 2-like n=1 Tax=Arachis duranensis TaxID=130453 RepID=A0A6P4B930_ARADU|nr:protein SENSITIVE TO PROTON RHIZOTOXICITY 2-like [Arachis duranensis]XP_052112492.1 protein SENSITIVE TO PROTON RHIZOTOXICITY 2-like [Arachis duranensis]
MISTSIEQNQGLMMQMFPTPPPGSEDLVSQQSMEIVNNSSVGSSSSSTAAAAASSSSHSSSLLFNLSVLKDKLNQVQTLVGVILSPDQNLQDSTTSMAVSSMNSTIQEIIPPPPPPPPPGTIATTVAFANNHHELHQQQHQRLLINNNNNNLRGFFSSTTDSEALDNWLGESYNNTGGVDCKVNNNDDDDPSVEISDSKEGAKKLDIIELDAADLLAKYTHYCSVCGKGFKRDANLRMHMRAHGDEYKTSAALSNPLKQNNNGENGDCLPKKYSCPQEGCRWNQKHAKFQPLKSMICAKNHYKRSHCPKMYVCKRCNQKQFSVLSDLRTHEKHCGDLKWQCSCGTTFSRKDKLMGHVALFVGHRALSIAFHQYNSAA